MKFSAKTLSILFGGLTALLLCIASATIAYQYRQMQFAILYEGASAPAGIAFLYAIPFGIAIAISATLCWIFYNRCKKADRP